MKLTEERRVELKQIKKTPLPKWCKDAQKAMIDMDMDATELAEKVGCSRQYVNAVLNARAKSDAVVTKITRVLDIDPPEGSIIFKEQN